MSVRFGTGTLSVGLAIVMWGLVWGVSASAQTPAAEKGVGSNVTPYSSSNKGAKGGTPSAETASANAKPATPSADPAGGEGDVPEHSKAPATPKADDTYIVGVADGLHISVWKEPDFSGPVVVRPDGMITVPVIGDVHVAGLTTKQVQDILTEKLKTVVTEPQVTVIVRDIRSRKVYLVGKVGHPGGVMLTGNETVLQVIAEAGGPSQFAKPQKMYVLRTTAGKEKRIPFDYKKVLSGAEPDLELEVGDVIVVP
jgi:polysaccharide biosynthesis/export protein